MWSFQRIQISGAVFVREISRHMSVLINSNLPMSVLIYPHTVAFDQEKVTDIASHPSSPKQQSEDPNPDSTPK